MKMKTNELNQHLEIGKIEYRKHIRETNEFLQEKFKFYVPVTLIYTLLGLVYMLMSSFYVIHKSTINDLFGFLFFVLYFLVSLLLYSYIVMATRNSTNEYFDKKVFNEIKEKFSNVLKTAIRIFFIFLLYLFLFYIIYFIWLIIANQFNIDFSLDKKINAIMFCECILWYFLYLFIQYYFSIMNALLLNTKSNVSIKTSRDIYKQNRVKMLFFGIVICIIPSICTLIYFITKFKYINYIAVFFNLLIIIYSTILMTFIHQRIIKRPA